MPKKLDATRYKIGEIALDENGVYWFNYVGTHPDQGGLSFRWGSIGLQSPKDLGQAVTAALTLDEDTHKAKIKEHASKG